MNSKHIHTGTKSPSPAFVWEETVRTCGKVFHAYVVFESVISLVFSIVVSLTFYDWHSRSPTQVRTFRSKPSWTCFSKQTRTKDWTCTSNWCWNPWHLPSLVLNNERFWPRGYFNVTWVFHRIHQTEFVIFWTSMLKSWISRRPCPCLHPPVRWICFCSTPNVWKRGIESVPFWIVSETRNVFLPRWQVFPWIFRSSCFTSTCAFECVCVLLTDSFYNILFNTHRYSDTLAQNETEATIRFWMTKGSWLNPEKLLGSALSVCHKRVRNASSLVLKWMESTWLVFKE